LKIVLGASLFVASCSLHLYQFLCGAVFQIVMVTQCYGEVPLLVEAARVPGSPGRPLDLPVSLNFADEVGV